MLKPFVTSHAAAPVIRGGGVSRRSLPVNLRPGDRALFEHDLERTIPPTRLVELRDVSMDPHGLLFKGARILPESFSSPVVRYRFFRRRSKTLRWLAVNAPFRRRRSLSGRHLVITDDWSAGYFHWVLDALPRLFAVRERARDLTVLLPYAFEPLEFVQASLKLFRLGGVEYVKRGEIAVCEAVVMPTHTAPSGHYNEGLMRELRDFVLDAYGIRSGAPAGERLYISRGHALKRRIANEEQVLGVLGEFGFRAVCFEDHPFHEQVHLAAGATHIVSNHGAGLANMLFMRPGCRTLELRRAGERERNWFFNLASAAGLDYYYQTCDPETVGDDPHTGNVVVDPRALRENLTAIVAPAAHL